MAGFRPSSAADTATRHQFIVRPLEEQEEYEIFVSFLKTCLFTESVCSVLHFSAAAPEAPVVATFRPGLGADTRIVTLQEEVEDCNLRTAPVQPAARPDGHHQDAMMGTGV